jgi:hypothetical protein
MNSAEPPLRLISSTNRRPSRQRRPVMTTFAPSSATRFAVAAPIPRLNSSVKPHDTLYFLGDFCLGRPDDVTAYRNRLSCRTIHFVEGNHDKTTRKLQHLFSSWCSLAEIYAGKQRIVLCHYAMRGRTMRVALGISTGIHTAICRTIRWPCRWMLEWILTIFVPGM